MSPLREGCRLGCRLTPASCLQRHSGILQDDAIRRIDAVDSLIPGVLGLALQAGGHWFEPSSADLGCYITSYVLREALVHGSEPCTNAPPDRRLGHTTRLDTKVDEESQRRLRPLALRA